MNTRMIAVAVSSLLAVAMVGYAGEASAVTCEELQLNKKPPIAFNPIPMKNPQTGEPYLPNEEIEVQPGVKMLASDFFNQVNDLEYDLNQWGYSLRDTDISTLSELKTCIELLAAQRNLISEDIRQNGPGPWSVEDRLKKVEAAWKRYTDQIPSWDELYQKADDESVRVYLPEVPPFSAPVPEIKRAELKPMFKERAWSFEVGEKSKLWLNAQASLSLRASKVDAVGDARGALNAALLGLWEGEVLSAQAHAQAPATDTGQLLVEVRGVGKVLWSKNWQQQGIRYDDKVEWPVHYEVSYRFQIGPIPAKAMFGFQATAGSNYGYDVLPLQVGAHAVPFASARAYAQVGIDLGLASAGVGGTLILAEDFVTLQGAARVEFDEEPTLIVELSGTNSLNALSGSLYAYARVNYFFGKWEGRWDFFRWEGFKRDGNLFNYKWVWSPSGVKATGDLKAEDVMEVNQANAELRLLEIENTSQSHLWATMKAISEDVNSPAVAKVLTEHSRVSSIASGLDELLLQYENQLREWTKS
ncbi:hypothetical protein [Archangium lipolyticum]|uniref:hypothetical protein n=1 Tax=Archangium lipolyticum TaxID=2970465 RepID=UPI00214A6D35|nr:hypothetical protein [Archangium lipolyticum]